MSKLKGVRLENEIDKSRGDSNWKRIHDLLTHVKARGSGQEERFSFLYGEWVLEKYLDDLITFPSPDVVHKEPLKKAEKFLHSVFEDSDFNARPQAQMALEAHLLLAKLHYVCGEFETAISCVSKARLDREDIQFHTLRTLRLVAEAYAIKGLSIERGSATSSSRYQRAMKEEQILAAFEKASDLALSYIAELEKAAAGTNAGLVVTGGSAAAGLSPGSTGVPLQAPPAWNSPIERIGLLMETALQRVPLMYIEQGWSGEAAAQSGYKQLCLERGVEQYRKVLTVSDKPVAHHLHQKLCRQVMHSTQSSILPNNASHLKLAEVLVRGVSDSIYTLPSHSDAAALKAKQLRFYLGSPAFCPQNKKEELLLILAISESIAAREAVLSRAEDTETLRQASHEDVKAVQNLLTLVLSSLGQYGLLTGILERALKFAFQDSFVWLQFALSLAAAQRYSRASLVLKECLTNEASEIREPRAYLMAAKLALEQVGDYEDGIRWAEKGLELAADGWLTGRARLLLGLAWSAKSQGVAEYAQRKAAAQTALQHLEEAAAADPRDALPPLFLGLQLALLRDTSAARTAVLRSLALDWEQPSAYMLLALLLTTTADYSDALHIVNEALSEHPNHYGLLVLRLKLLMVTGDAREALATAKDLLMFWKLRSGPLAPIQATGGTLESWRAYTPGLGGDDTADSGINAASTLLVSAAGGTLPRSLSGLDVAGERESVLAATASEMGTAASTISVTNSSGMDRKSLASAWRTQANVWLELAEMFLEAGRMSEVSVCVEEATAAFPNSHQTLYLRGRILALRAEEEEREERKATLLEEAKGAFLGSLALFPAHLPSLRHLATAYHAQGNLRMAEKILKDVLRMEPVEEGSWSALGRVIAEWAEARESEAAEAFATAALLQASAPVLPYSIIPRVLHF